MRASLLEVECTRKLQADSAQILERFARAGEGCGFSTRSLTRQSDVCLWEPLSEESVPSVWEILTVQSRLCLLKIIPTQLACRPEATPEFRAIAQDRVRQQVDRINELVSEIL